jgi:hypothetical protein
LQGPRKARRVAAPKQSTNKRQRQRTYVVHHTNAQKPAPPRRQLQRDAAATGIAHGKVAVVGVNHRIGTPQRRAAALSGATQFATPGQVDGSSVAAATRLGTRSVNVPTLAPKSEPALQMSLELNLAYIDAKEHVVRRQPAPPKPPADANSYRLNQEEWLAEQMALTLAMSSYNQNDT